MAHIYKCPKNCHVRIYPFWVGEEGEKCPRCGEWILYRGDKTQTQLDDMVREASRQLIPKKKLKRKKK